MRKKGGRVKKADGGAYTGMPANYQPGFVQSAFGTGNLPHLQTAGMMATGDTVNRTNNYLQGKFAFDPTGTQASLPQQAPVNQQVENAYRYYLDRPSEPSGNAHWKHQMAEGLDVGGLGKQMQASPEYASRWGLPQPLQPSPQERLKSTDNTPSGKLVDQMYINMLGRLPEPAGKEYWLRQLAEGMSPGELQQQFVSSVEGKDYIKNRSYESLANEMAGGPPTQTSLQQSQNYFSGPRAPGSMPASMVPSLQNRNAEQLRYQMSPEAIAADQAMNAEELAEKQRIIDANLQWQKAEDERIAKMTGLEKEQAIAKKREDEEAAEAKRRADAAAQQQMLLFLLMSCDRRGKTNIVYVGKNAEGIKLYAFDYVDDIERCRLTGEMMPPKRVGPMAQDLEESFPERVLRVGKTLLITGTYELRPVTV